jgi:hypothetical protein
MLPVTLVTEERTTGLEGSSLLSGRAFFCVHRLLLGWSGVKLVSNSK